MPLGVRIGAIMPALCSDVAIMPTQFFGCDYAKIMPGIRGWTQVGEDEKKSLLDAWDAEYRKLTDIAQRLQHDEDLRVLRGQLSDRQTKNWINWDIFVGIVKPLTQEAIAVFGGLDAAALATERSPGPGGRTH